MKFSLVGEQRQEAQPKLSGTCPACGNPVIAKCGKVRIWHWAHKGEFACDPWWENETEWHRAWKGHFPADWQEVVHQGPSGEKHIADVKTDQGWVLEFQHSHMKPEERQSRDNFYPKLVWVVDALRRKRDRVKFADAWNRGAPVGRNPRVRKIRLDTTLLREWADSSAHVFFDFGLDMHLVSLISRGAGPIGHALAFPRMQLINFFLNREAQNFEALMREIKATAAHLRL